MEDKNRIEMDIADAIMERPFGFTVGNQSFLYIPQHSVKHIYLQDYSMSLT